MGNQTTLSEFLLSGLTDNLHTQYLLFLIFLLTYLMTLAGNLLIIFLALTDSHLHSPMYFFLGNLALLDMSYSSVTAPRMLFDFFTIKRTISIPACITQVFFFIYFACAEVLLLAAMSYDRHIAICRPLHYIEIMSWKVCTQLASVVWVLGLLCSLVHTLCLLRLTYCGPNTIYNFFCDLPHLLQLSCTDTFINIVVIFILGGVLAIGAFSITFFPYVNIFRTVFRIRSNQGKIKTFSTCTSHLTVVFIFYGSLIFIYFVPKTSYLFVVNKILNVNYSVINPLLNPIIYSLRNKDLKTAFTRAFCHRSSE